MDKREADITLMYMSLSLTLSLSHSVSFYLLSLHLSLYIHTYIIFFIIIIIVIIIDKMVLQWYSICVLCVLGPRKARINPHPTDNCLLYYTKLP